MGLLCTQEIRKERGEEKLSKEESYPHQERGNVHFFISGFSAFLLLKQTRA
jgi:hypothetical protein